ncbi:MAG: hypothetical protein HC914_00160 [Chloroflexaceae bacterium]|nr:hypothetical protein [Chloroflexaceae bacterium]
MQIHNQGLPHAAQRVAPQHPALSFQVWLLRALKAEGQAWQTALSYPALYILLLGMALGFLVAVQVPLNYSIDVGIEEGYGGDLPHLRNFNTAEQDSHGTYRWTRDEARIVMPGLGQRAVTVRLDFFPISAEVLAIGPSEIELWVQGEPLATLPVQMPGGHYSIRVPSHLLEQGTLDLLIRTATFVPPDPDDPRSLGTPLDRVTVSTGTSFPAAPDWGAFGLWLAAALLAWATMLRALDAVPRAPHWATGLLAGVAPLVVLSAFLDPPRWAFGAQPALIATVISYALVLALRPTVRYLARQLDIPLDGRTVGWLLLIVVLAFGTRYGGRLYPRSMHGDIGFHTNRFNEVTGGYIYIVSRNRGVNFPYPPGPYLVLAPWLLVAPDPSYLLQLSAALVEGLSALFIYAMVARTGAVAAAWRQRQQHHTATRQSRAPPLYSRIALLAAGIYVFTAAGYMTTWWSFDTHIYTQFATLVLITALVLFGLRCCTAAPRPITPLWAAVLLLLVGLVFLGHFGFFINTALLGGMALLIVLPLAWRGVAWAQMARTPLLVAGVGGLCLALLLFYTAYLWLFIEQARVTASSGLTGLAERAPVPRWYLWQVLWQVGIIQHFGFFPLLLAPLGVWQVGRQGRPAWIMGGLLVGSFLVSLAFAVLPFITLSTQSTRWLMFSAWAVAIGAAFAVQLLWRSGRAARLLVAVMGGYVLWNTFVFWIGPMLWRIRPPEPF